ncbi:hypothetical protein C8F04DRAFT_1097364 [Mycena alexandri]|uniref:Uncharacterized protein n=1 Tax=Mycena alexandri TaxID=1745969 RepID=A0AAD6SXU2_9AGAR|nr:hypothetical protein C8F04DRAFT_1097364 [Mycena alexandri]
MYVRIKPSNRATTQLALARLARTCKTLSEPALDVLWTFQGTVFNVLKCLPRDLWPYNWTLRIRRPILRRD